MSEPQKSEMPEQPDLESKSTTYRGRLEKASVYLQLTFEVWKREEELKREGKSESEAKKLAMTEYWENVGSIGRRSWGILDWRSDRSG
jgi:hypothetical protein